MNKLLTTITLLCFSFADNAETYVCSTPLDSGRRVDLITITRTDAGFTIKSAGVTMTSYKIINDRDTWLLLMDTTMSDDYFFYTLIAINKENMAYYSLFTTTDNNVDYPREGQCTWNRF